MDGRGQLHRGSVAVRQGQLRRRPLRCPAPGAHGREIGTTTTRRYERRTWLSLRDRAGAVRRVIAVRRRRARDELPQRGDAVAVFAEAGELTQGYGHILG